MNSMILRIPSYGSIHYDYIVLGISWYLFVRYLIKKGNMSENNSRIVMYINNKETPSLPPPNHLSRFLQLSTNHKKSIKNQGLV